MELFEIGEISEESPLMRYRGRILPQVSTKFILIISSGAVQPGYHT